VDECKPLLVGVPATRMSATHTALGHPLGVASSNLPGAKTALDQHALKLQMRQGGY